MAGKIKQTDEKIRVGVIGVGRGQSFSQAANEVVGMKLVALCDIWKERLKEVDFDETVGFD